MANNNSDDLVFSDPPSSPSRNSRAGEKSIGQICEHAAADRISSKRTVKQLQFGRGVLTSRRYQHLWQKKTWIGFAVLSRLVRAFLTRASDQGVQNWDVAIAKCLSVVLVGGLGARTGDVVLATGYKDKDYYLQYRHIELYIEGDEPTFANLRARIKLEFSKCHKETANEEIFHRFRPLLEAHDSHMCPIAWLLVHCL
ncbi:hypothetical protein B0A54_09471 [Friedmanniomyces endolithicus]|uniref:Uncharacterized protein n=1 Tax=Friedmanniomyces endolithicus TaxID=329885 RepID=A0A4U0UTY6_9PEZI|nr:hypothetical protein B0A54_09471 [Friedmanniomyces endolithicus]